MLMDADLQDEPEQLPALLAKLEEGSDVVYTVNVDDDRRRRLAPDLGALPLLVLEGRPRRRARDRSAPIASFNRKFREALLSYPERRPLYGPLMLYMGFTAAFVPVERQPRRDGRERLHVRQAARARGRDARVVHERPTQDPAASSGRRSRRRARCISRSRRRLLRSRAATLANGSRCCSASRAADGRSAREPRDRGLVRLPRVPGGARSPALPRSPSQSTPDH